MPPRIRKQGFMAALLDGTCTQMSSVFLLVEPSKIVFLI